jgi:TfoX/Sxy family transcriptional regulator of competence genes
MSTSPSQIEYFKELLFFVPELEARKMFGEYGLYTGYDNERKFFALICDSKLFLKATDSLKKLVVDDGVKAYDAPNVPYLHIDENDLEDQEKLKTFVTAALDFVPKPKKSKKSLDNL